MFEKVKAKRRAARNRTRITGYGKLAAVTATQVTGARLVTRAIANRASASRATVQMKKSKSGVWSEKRSLSSRKGPWDVVNTVTGAVIGTSYLNKKEKKQLGKDVNSARTAVFGPPRGSLKYKLTSARKAALKKAQRASARARKALGRD